MKSKSLLAGATAPFVGPWVNVEQGEWRVELPVACGRENFRIEISEFGDEEGYVFQNIEARIFGPARLRVHLEEGKNVFLSVEQLSRA